jgi:hypothetical protein
MAVAVSSGCFTSPLGFAEDDIAGLISSAAGVSRE